MTMSEHLASTPLADRMRPRKLSDVIGQEHIIGQNQFLRTIIQNKTPVSLILWGPPGTGKTTLARIIAGSSGYEFREVSAVTSGLADVKKVIEEAQQNKRLGSNTILFVDEIHRFNKAQQDAFLPHVENGNIILIGATTENPSFEVIGPLLSRSRVVVLNSLTTDQIKKILRKAIKQLGNRAIDSAALQLLAELAAGDARTALNGLEAAATIEPKKITVETIKQAMQRLTLRHDKTGEYHYNTISAFIKSMRGGDVDATLFYLARMVESGEDPKFIARRMVIFASEDIGLASLGALNLAVSTFQVVERIGYPECNYALFQCAITLSRSKKSRSVANSMFAAQKAARANPDAQVPLHLRNAPTKLMKELGYQKDTKWEAGFEHPKGFMPEGLEDLKLYEE